MNMKRPERTRRHRPLRFVFGVEGFARTRERPPPERPCRNRPLQKRRKDEYETMRERLSPSLSRLVFGVRWLLVGGWCLVAGGWWLVVGGWVFRGWEMRDELVPPAHANARPTARAGTPP